jgi:microcystin degradation protein MlrC
MKLVIAQMKHETNTFSPVPTPLARFGVGGAARGRCRGGGLQGHRLGDGRLHRAGRAGRAPTYVVPMAGGAWPSGPVDDAAFEHICGRICAAVARGCDAVLLDLHGAMVTQTHDDGEGELLRRIRAVAPSVPIGVALDMHTNLYDAMGQHATVMAGYQTYPHVDMYETGLRAGRAVLAHAGRQRRSPAMAWGRQPCCRT